jgi:hypothetical protein
MGLVCSLSLVACASDQRGQNDEAFGTIALPLGTYGESGTRYRLRDATFVIRDPYEYGYGGEGSNSTVVVSSEDDPNADSISVSVEQGSYYVTLQPGWRMEKREADGGFTTVEAQLLSSTAQWVYVAPRSTSWAAFNFGIGGREVWFNGKLNIGINVYEDPDEYYGNTGGFGGAGE